MCFSEQKTIKLSAYSRVKRDNGNCTPMCHGKWEFNGTIQFAGELKRTCLVCPSWFAVATQTWLTESCVKCVVGVQINVFASFLPRLSQIL